MMPLIDHHCKKRNKNFKKEDKHDLQESIDNLIWKNQMQSIHLENRKRGTGSKKCWAMVNKITGRKCSSQCQLCSKLKCNQPLLQRDKYWYGIFCSSWSWLPYYPDLYIQVLEPHTVEKFLAKQKRKTSSSKFFHIHFLWWSWSCSIVQSVA